MEYTPEIALRRAETGNSVHNDDVVRTAARQKGLGEVDPRRDVLTFRAWQAKGRQVKRGEHKLCSIRTWIKDERTGKSSPRFAAVFHISQTIPVNGDRTETKEAPRPAIEIPEHIRADKPAMLELLEKLLNELK